MKKNKKAYHQLTFQILLAVALGIALGLILPASVAAKGAGVSKLVIHWIKIIAGPYLFLSILQSFLKVHIKLKKAVSLVAIASFNALIAIFIAFFMFKIFLSKISLKLNFLEMNNSANVLSQKQTSESFFQILKPESVFQPFEQNNILLIAILGVVFGVALKKVCGENNKKVVYFLEAARELFLKILKGIIKIVPLVITLSIAATISESGFRVYGQMMKFVGVVLLGFSIQILVTYGIWIFVLGKKPIRKTLQIIKVPFLYSLGVNSSLATLPLTLKSLDEMGVSQDSATLGAGVATNLNNDGIILYEVVTILFILHLTGVQVGFSVFASASLACVVAAMGITGVPEAGFVSLSVVATTMGLPIEILSTFLSVDWILARARSVVNVMSDIALSVAVDRFKQ